MKKNRMDSITDAIKERMKSIYGEIHNQYGGTNPYRQEKVSKKEMLLNYDDMMSRETQLREDFGDDVIDQYRVNMGKYLGGK